MSHPGPGPTGRQTSVPNAVCAELRRTLPALGFISLKETVILILAAGLSTQSLVTYLQGLFAPLFLGLISIMAVFYLFKREMIKFVEFIALAILVAIVFYTPSVIQVLAAGLAAALGIHA
jgi:hypothetical protein